MQDWSKKRKDKIFALNACVNVVVAGKTGKDLRENCGTERLRSRVNRNKNRYAIVPFPCDILAGKFLKDGAQILATPVSELCNLSISLSLFPEDCKQAKLKPLFKKGSRDEPKNYRPISLLPQISKVIEKIVHEQVLAERQNAFGRSDNDRRKFWISTKSQEIHYL